MGRKAYERFRCSCGEDCVMVPSASTGKLAPIETHRKPGGNIELEMPSSVRDHATYRIVDKRELAAEPKQRFYNHWATCKDADRFRR